MKNWFGWDLLVDGGRGKMWMAVYVLLVMGVLKKCIHSKKEGKTYAGFNLPKSCVMIRFDF